MRVVLGNLGLRASSGPVPGGRKLYYSGSTIVHLSIVSLRRVPVRKRLLAPPRGEVPFSPAARSAVAADSRRY